MIEAGQDINGPVGIRYINEQGMTLLYVTTGPATGWLAAPMEAGWRIVRQADDADVRGLRAAGLLETPDAANAPETQRETPKQGRTQPRG